MKTKAAYILILLGTVGLIGQVFYRIQREKTILETQMQAQQSSLVEGLKAEWKSRLLQEAKAGKLEPTFRLRWNRKGTELRDLFFPLKKSSMNWERYRNLVKGKRVAESEQFLQKALARQNSWDRVLAITEWHSQYNTFPETFTEYERTLVNSEAKLAYQFIFEQFSGYKDFTFASSEVDYDKVFYFVSNDGSIEAFVPSLKQVQEEILPKFLAENNLSSAQLANNPWSIVLPQSLREKVDFSYIEFLWLSMALICFLAGVVIYFGSLREQKNALLKKVSFLNQVVHELKTPLTGLKLHLQLIQKGKGNERNLQALDTSLDRLNRLFDDVLLMNRPFEKIDAKLIKSEDAKKMLLDFGEEFSNFKVDQNFASDFYGDEKRLKVILRNLIKNGIRYGKEVAVRVTNESGKIIVFVKDSGPGISEADSRKIFQEFFRSDEAKKVNADGLGLGLYLVKKMAQEMGATVELVNPGQPGAIFKLTLLGPSNE